MGRNGIPVLAGGLALVLAAALQAEDRPWIEVRSPRFIVVSQSGEKASRDLAWQFEQVHSLFSRAYPWAKLESGRPFFVLAVRNENALRELSPDFWKRWNMTPGAAYVSADGQDFVAIRTDIDGAASAGENPYANAYEGYVNIVLNASFPGRLPFWFERGLQNFFGNTLVREKDVHVGRLIKRYMDLLGRGGRYSLPDLMAMQSDSPSFRQEAGREVFEAQTWLLVHYLFFGENGANLPKLNRYAALLREGRPAADAFREAIGDPTAVQKGLSMYVSRRLYGYTQLNIDVNVDRSSFRVRPVPAPEAGGLRAQFQSAIREPASSVQALAQGALQADARQPLAHEALGLLADREGREDEARSAFDHAVDDGSQSYWAHYRLAQLLWKPDADRATRERVAKILEKAVQLNPDHAWSYRFLADTRRSLDDAAGALEPARKAVQLAPGESLHRSTLALVLGSLGQRDAARQEAERALAVAKEDGPRNHAREVLAWLARQPETAANPGTPAPADGEAATTPSEAAKTDQAAKSDEATKTDEAAKKAKGGRTVRLDQHPCELKDAGPCTGWLAAAEKACADGSLEACSSAGWAYTAAPAVPRDPAKATRLLEKACSGGHQDGCVNLAVNLANRQTPEALDRALAILDKSCASGHRQACSLQSSLKGRRR